MNKFQKIAIIGAGAMGSLFAYFLAKAKKDVRLLDKYPHRRDKIRNEGLIVERMGVKDKVTVPISTEAQDIGKVDLVILWVKAYDTEGATYQAKSLMGKDSVILSLQNGLGNLEIIRSIVGEERVIGGTTAHGATLTSLGEIRHAGVGDTIIGEISGEITERVKALRDLFNSCGIETRITDDLSGYIWGKLLVNAAINPLTAIFRVRNGALIEFPSTHRLLKEISLEVYEVAKRKRIHLPYDDPLKKVESIAKNTGANISSMLQDVLNAKRTEINEINGQVVAEGEKLGLSSPFNQAVLLLVKGLEESYRVRLS